MKTMILIVGIIISTNLASLAMTTFTDVTQDAGVGHEGKGFSAAFLDYNNDGNLDLIIANGDGPNVLYKNNGDDTFDNVAEAAGVDNKDIGTGTGPECTYILGRIEHASCIMSYNYFLQVGHKLLNCRHWVLGGFIFNGQITLVARFA